METQAENNSSLLPHLRALWPTDKIVPFMVPMSAAADVIGISRTNLHRVHDQIGLKKLYVGSRTGISAISLEEYLVKISEVSA